MEESKRDQQLNKEEGAAATSSISRRRFIASIGVMAGAAITSQIPAGIKAYAEQEDEDGDLLEGEGNYNTGLCVLADWFNVKEHNAAADGLADDASALDLLIQSTTQQAEATFYFPAGTYRIGSPLTFPKRVRLFFDYGAILVPDAGVTVNVFSQVNAGLGHIFGGTGRVTGDFYGQGVYPQWWGAKGDKQTDDTEAFRNVFRLSKDNQITEAQMQSVHADNGDNVQIRGSVITKGRGNGIDCEILQGLIVDDNQISDTTKALSIKTCHNARVTGNQTSRMSANVMEITDTEGLFISGNFLTGGATSVIDALVIAGMTKMGIVRDNILSGAFRRGIWFKGTTSNIKYGYNLGAVQNDSNQVTALQD